MLTKLYAEHDEADGMGTLGEILHFSFGTDLIDVEMKIDEFEAVIKEYENQTGTYVILDNINRTVCCAPVCQNHCKATSC